MEIGSEQMMRCELSWIKNDAAKLLVMKNFLDEKKGNKKPPFRGGPFQDGKLGIISFL
jgi:hypothetical protein